MAEVPPTPVLSSGFDDFSAPTANLRLDIQKPKNTAAPMLPAPSIIPAEPKEPESLGLKLINEINDIKNEYTKKQKTIQDERERAIKMDEAMAAIFLEELQLECVKKVSHIAAFDALFHMYPINKINIRVPLQGYWTDHFEEIIKRTLSHPKVQMYHRTTNKPYNVDGRKYDGSMIIGLTPTEN